MDQSNGRDKEPDVDQLMTLPEAASILRTPIATLRYWRSRGVGPPCFKLGRRVVYRRVELEAWVDAKAARG